MSETEAHLIPVTSPVYLERLRVVASAVLATGARIICDNRPYSLIDHASGGGLRLGRQIAYADGPLYTWVSYLPPDPLYNSRTRQPIRVSREP